MRLFGVVFGGRNWQARRLCNSSHYAAPQWGFAALRLHAYLFVNRGLGHWPATLHGSFQRDMTSTSRVQALRAGLPKAATFTAAAVGLAFEPPRRW